MTEWDEDPLLEIGKVDQNLWLYKAQPRTAWISDNAGWQQDENPPDAVSAVAGDRGGVSMDGYTLTLVIIGAATVSYWFVRLVDKLDRPGK